jgi:lipopolysaccharide transport system permease protein
MDSDQIEPKISPLPVAVYIPQKGKIPRINWKELWEYRDLLYFLTWRDVIVRYKQTLLGAAWAILQPVLTMVVFTFFFGNLAKVATGNIPYPIFSYTGLLPGGLFSKAISDA